MVESLDFTVRDYRNRAVPAGLVAFGAAVGETDLWIAADRDLRREALRSIRAHRAGIELYIKAHPGFATTLVPWRADTPDKLLPALMVKASAAVGTGPMAAVAGAMAEAVVRDLSRFSSRVIVENGGDIYLLGPEYARVGLWAGRSPLSGKIGLAVDASSGVAVCTSSGTVGPSLSFGNSDSATVISPSGALADAAATELGNRVKTPGDIENALDWMLSIPGITGAVVIMGDIFGVKGDIEIVPLSTEFNKKPES